MKALGLASIVACTLAVGAMAQEAPPAEQGAPSPEQEALHNELRELKQGLVEAVLKQDFDAQLKYVTPDVVVTWQNGEVVRGPQALRAFLDKNQEQAKKIFQGYKEPPEPAELTILYGDDTGVSYGKSVGRYQVLGREIELTNQWTATLVKQDGRWLVASYHVSNDILHNPLVDAAKASLYGIGGVALVVGGLLGWFGRTWLGGRRPA